MKTSADMSKAVEAAVDNQINNFIEMHFAEFHNIEKY